MLTAANRHISALERKFPQRYAIQSLGRSSSAKKVLFRMSVEACVSASVSGWKKLGAQPLSESKKREEIMA